MPLYDQHMAQATHNRALLAFLVQQDKQAIFSDWYVTIAFYTALHYFEAVLSVSESVTHRVSKNVIKHCPNHLSRNELIKIGFSQLHPSYSALYKMSRAARYTCNAPNSYSCNRAETMLARLVKECEKLSS
jgi:hypothetical protein